jgi:hypothetical protein
MFDPYHVCHITHGFYRIFERSPASRVSVYPDANDTAAASDRLYVAIG